MNECLQLPESPAGVTGTVCPRSALGLLTPQRSSGPGGPKRTEKSAKTLREIIAKLRDREITEIFAQLIFIIVINMLISQKFSHLYHRIFPIGFPNRTGKPLNHIREFSAKPREISAKNLL